MRKNKNVRARRSSVVGEFTVSELGLSILKSVADFIVHTYLKGDMSTMAKRAMGTPPGTSMGSTSTSDYPKCGWREI